ncbi:MAG: hypothetical protein LBH19_10265 [Dysgonamonadaceae bacterium]|jgi:hypothetical protein|nr:hypothetical protein [Dysgonamonadaceae bacterium]
MKKILKLLFISSLLYSCMEDKGNYDYQAVGEIKIDTVGMANRAEIFNLELGKEIEIEPNVIYSKSLDELEYYWVIYPYNYAPVQDGNAMVYPQADTISRTRKLKWTVNAKPGSYYLQFVATDPVNKLRSFFTFAGIAIPEKGVKSGLYILSEYDGQTDIDLFGSARALIIGGNHFEPHYYSENHGGDMIPGKPLFISYGRDYYYAFTDRTGLRLNTNSLMLMENFSEMFYAAPGYNPSNLKYTNNCEFLINNGRLHVLYTNKTNDRKFSNAVAGDYQAGRFLQGNTKTSYGHITDAIDADQIIFDLNTNGFRPYFPQASSIGSFKQTEADAISDANHLNGNVKATFEANGGQTYNIVEINGRDSLIVLNFYNVIDDGDLSAGSGSRVSLSGCKDIGDAGYFASSNAGNAFFYATGKAVHSFSYTSGQTAQLDIYTCAPNEEITALYVLPSGGFPTSGCVLWIGVWNESAKTGSLVEFEIDPTSGNISNQWTPMFAPTLSNPSITSGFGKIKSMIIKM